MAGIQPVLPPTGPFSSMQGAFQPKVGILPLFCLDHFIMETFSLNLLIEASPVPHCDTVTAGTNLL